jgi:hypothetical protein
MYKTDVMIQPPDDTDLTKVVEVDRTGGGEESNISLGSCDSSWRRM